MSLDSGTRIGAYEIIGVIGAGGMGEVYRARDTTLDRDVALKVLPESLASDPDRLMRFEREAKTLASLNHPNVAQVYGVEGVVPPSGSEEVRPLRQAPSGSEEVRPPRQAIVMELVEGEDLAARLTRDPIPLDEALTIARQVADALDAAHEKGVVHRDLKPANIKVTPEGVVKVLDFGLAKAVAGPEDPASGSNIANSPTLTARATQLGMILGTAAYMSPEQAKGRSVDRRADIWAFGAVLFEMLAGRRAFEGDDVSEVLASVIKGEADWQALPAGTPAAVRRLLERCLEKDPKRRLRDIADGMIELDERLAAPVAPVATGPVAPRAPLWRRLLPVAAAVLLTAAATSFVTTALRPAPAPADRVTFSMQPEGFSGFVRRGSLALSPSGRLLLYGGAPVTDAPTAFTQLYLRPLDEIGGRAVIGAENAAMAVFSPDEEWIAFTRIPGSTRIFKVPVGGGPDTLVCESVEPVRGIAWSRDDVLVFGTSAGLFSVPAGGGQPAPVTSVSAGTTEAFQHWPTLVSGTDLAVFVSGAARDQLGTLAAVRLGTGEVTKLGIEGTSPQYLSSGHVAYVTADGALRAVPFDASSVTTTGDAVPLVASIGLGMNGRAYFDVSETGMLVYWPVDGQFTEHRRLVWVDRDGRASPIAAEPRSYTYPRISPDGTRLAVESRDEEEDVWVWDFNVETLRRLTTGPAPDQYPVWTPDGRRIVWSSFQDDRNGVYVVNADGTGAIERLADSDVELSPNAMVPDGTGVIVRTFRTLGSNTDLFFVPLTGGDVRPIVAAPFSEANASISPDGRWLAYQDNTSGRTQVTVRPFPDVDEGNWQVSTQGGRDPIWSRDGRELYYVDPEGTMMRVPVTFTPTFAHELPQPLFDASSYESGIGRNFDIASDGRFLMVETEEAAVGEQPELVVVVNWLDEVRARVKRR